MQRRDLDFHSLDQVIGDIEQLRRSKCGRVGQWDLGQTVGHLTRAVNGSMDGFSTRVPWLMRKLLKRVALREVMNTRKIRPGVKIKGMVIIDSGADVGPLLEELRAAVTRFETFQGEHALHPFFEKLSRDQWKQLHLIHCAHHLSFQVPTGKDAG